MTIITEVGAFYIDHMTDDAPEVDSFSRGCYQALSSPRFWGESLGMTLAFSRPSLAESGQWSQESLTLCTYLVAVWLSSSLTHDSSMSGCNTVWAIVTPTYTETIVMCGNLLPKYIYLLAMHCRKSLIWTHWDRRVFKSLKCSDNWSMMEGAHVMLTVCKLEWASCNASTEQCHYSHTAVRLSPLCNASPGYQVLKTNLWTLHM